MTTNERGDDPRMASFLIGFFCGALLAGGGGFAAFVYQTGRLARVAEAQAAAMAKQLDMADADRRMALALRGRAELERAKAEEELRKAKPDGPPMLKKPRELDLED